MTHTSLNGYIARSTDKAVAFMFDAQSNPIWVPYSKIAEEIETDELDIDVQLKGEKIMRLAYPVVLTVDTAFLEKIGVTV